MAYSKSLHGSTGAVALPAGFTDLTVDTDMHVTEWHATFTREAIDDTSFTAATNWKTCIGGMYHMTGTCTGVLAQAASPVVPLADLGTANAGATAGFILTVMTGQTYTFSGIISNINIVTPKTNLVRVTLSFESHGEITVA